MTLDDLNKKIGLTNRSFKICFQNGLTDLSSILNYYGEKGGFLDLTNCGLRTNLELKMLCEMLLAHYKNGSIKSLSKDEDTVIEDFDKLDDSKKKKLNQFLSDKVKNMPTRSRNSLYRFLDGDINVDQLFQRAVSDPYFDPLSIEGVGQRSAEDLKQLFKTVYNKIIELSLK